MAIAVVRSAGNNSATVSSSPATVTITSPAAGNLLVVGIGVTVNAGDSLITDPAGFTQIYDDVLTGDIRLWLGYKETADGTETSISGALSANRNWVICYCEISGDATSPLDQQAHISSAATATTLDSGTTPTTTQANEVAVAWVVNKNNTLQTNDGSAGYTQQVVQQSHTGTNVNAVAGALYTKILSATGAQRIQPTIGTARAYAGSIATFKEASGVVAPVRFRTLLGVGK